MTFEGQYLTYAEYQELGGSAIDLMPFNILEQEARKRIDIKTQNRLIGVEEIPKEVKLCIFRLINRIYSYEKNIESSSVSSETTDGYSVSYNQVKDIINSKNVELDNIIMSDLYGVIVNNEHLIYNGVK